MAIIRLIYSLLLFFATLLAAPAWVLKMKRRGGWGSGLIQRLGVHDDEAFRGFQNKDYYHAVSVGEVVMAIKVIKEIQTSSKDYKAIIAVTTATGQQIATAQLPPNTKVIYAPLDFTLLIHTVLNSIKPKQVILVDSELWPNLLSYTEKNSIPLKIINGRISDNSYDNLRKFKGLISPLIQHIKAVCVDGDTQVERWRSLGVLESNIHNVGSLKFDLESDNAPAPQQFSEQLTKFGNAPVILISSTHAGEEVILVRELQKVRSPYRLAVAPRHAERREEITTELDTLGITVTKRSDFSTPSLDNDNAFLIDTTGELTLWMKLADIVIIGKSWLKKGGQNPFEAIIQGVPTICGPHMNNFEPLLSEVVAAQGALQLANINELAETVDRLLNNKAMRSSLANTGVAYLSSKTGATKQTAAQIL